MFAFTQMQRIAKVVRRAAFACNVSDMRQLPEL